MKFRRTAKWSNLSEVDGLLFFSQRAEELLFDYTLDSHKTFALNSVYLCQEAIRLVRDIERGLIDRSNLITVVEELSWSISEDMVAKSLLDLPKEKYLIDSKSEPLQRVKVKLEVLGRTLAPYRYLDRCLELLKEAVKNGTKSDIDKLASLLFTTLINLGLHKSHLYEKTISFFFTGDYPKVIDSNNYIEDFIKYIYPVEHQFDVLFLASELLSDVQNSAEKVFGVKFYKSLPSNVKSFARENDFKVRKTEVIARVDEIRALDCYTAREKAETRLSQLRDLFTLYHHKAQIEWRSDTLIKQCCTDSPRIVGLPKNPMEKGYDQKPERASEQLLKMLKSFRLERRDFQKFNRAVDFHGLSVNNSNPENQLLNLWIALETIVPTHTGSAKIRQVVEGILPFLALNYFWRLIGRLAQDLFRWDKRVVGKILKKVPNSRGLAPRKKVFLLLVRDDAKDLRTELYAKLRDFHLLRYRVFSLSKSINSPAKALAYLEEHERLVAWQIRRMYRTRNLIIHSGRTPPYIQTLIENGHDYLDQVLMTITRMSGGPYNIMTIDQAFELAKVTRAKIARFLKANSNYSSDIGDVIGEFDFIKLK